MRKEDIVVSPELAKKLKEAGVNSLSLFYWRVWSDGAVDLAMEHEDDFDYSGVGRKVTEKIPAYTVTELMGMLPSLIREGLHYTLCIYKHDDSYIAGYERLSEDFEIELLCEFENEKFADALAEMLIWCRERGK